MNAIRISTRAFENSNAGRKPRPSQSGLWMFDLIAQNHATRFQASGKYADTLKAAKANARSIGADSSRGGVQSVSDEVHPVRNLSADSEAASRAVSIG
jgi:hypothetical protein